MPPTRKDVLHSLTFFGSIYNLKDTIIPLKEVILHFTNLRGTKPQMLTHKGYDDHLRHFSMGSSIK